MKVYRVVACTDYESDRPILCFDNREAAEQCLEDVKFRWMVAREGDDWDWGFDYVGCDGFEIEEIEVFSCASDAMKGSDETV